MTHKSRFPKGYRSVSQLASFIGVTPRRIEQMYAAGEIPKPETVLDDGTKLWSASQAKEIMECRSEKQRAKARRALPPTALMRRRTGGRTT